MKSDGTQGIFFFENVETIEFDKNGVLLVTNQGREIRLGSDFYYLKRCF
jgi:hypothetical protein